METTTSTVIERVARVELRVRDIPTSVGFYRDVVGLELLAGDATTASLGAPGGSEEVVRLSSQGVTRPDDRRSTGLFHTAFLYPDRPALADALARLAQGRFEVGVGDHGVSEALYVDDPDGNGVELYRDRPRNQWPVPPPGQKMAMITAPIDLDRLLDDRGSEHDGPGGIGHVHLRVAAIDETVAFYRDVIGFELMQEMLGSAAFLSSHGYHHHVGANVWHSMGAQPAPRDQAGLERVVFAARRSEIDALTGRLGAAGVAYEDGADGLEVTDPSGIVLRFEPAG